LAKDEVKIPGQNGLLILKWNSLWSVGADKGICNKVYFAGREVTQYNTQKTH